VVLDEQHGQPELVPHLPDQLRELVHLAVRQATRRLVQQQQPGLGREGTGEFEPLQRPERLAPRGRERQRAETEQLEQVVTLAPQDRKSVV
jgi:hypothetical protein